MKHQQSAALAAATTLCILLGAMTGSASAQTQLAQAKAHINHVIVIMQENRSFDHYFGTFPGAEGIKFDANGVPLMCYPLSKTGGDCVRPYHDRHNINAGANHHSGSSATDIGKNTMDGFLIVQQRDVGTCQKSPTLCPGQTRHDSVGYHTANEIPNYWAYAQHFVLQDHLFEPVATWSLPSHLYATSAWSATCTDNHDPWSCTDDLEVQKPAITAHNFAWSDVTDLLDRAGISWKYYLSQGNAPDCDEGEAGCPPETIGPTVVSEWNPLPGFQEIQDKNTATPGYLAGHIPPFDQFYADLNAGALPAVSWIIPNQDWSEHPTGDVTEGMQYVTALINTVMQNPVWQNTVIFLAWDDWGGFFDHVVPPVAALTNQARVGYGIRVPGIIISPWVKAGTIDHQVLSFDAYLKFIEDLFLNSQRIGGFGGVRPDSRTVVRESLTSITQPTGSGFTGQPVPVGDLLNDFNFSQAPLGPLLLPTNIPNTFEGTFNASTLTFTFPLTWLPVTTGPVAGYTVYRTTTSGSNYQPVPGCSAAFGQPFTGTSCTDNNVTPGVTYYYVVTSTAPNGVESARSGEQDITP